VIPPVSLSHWHILGAGAIGGLWAIRLHELGCRVSLIEHASPLTTHRTLYLLRRDREVCHDFPVRALNDHHSPSPLLVTTKARDTATALAPLLKHLRSGDIVLLLQNGMGVDDRLRQQRSDLTILTGITTDGVFRTHRSHLTLAGMGKTLLGGETTVEQAIATQIAQQWQRSDAEVIAVPDIRQHRWQKLAINCVINPLTALYRCRNGELENHAKAITTMRTHLRRSGSGHAGRRSYPPTARGAMFASGPPDRPANGGQHFLHAGGCAWPGESHGNRLHEWPCRENVALRATAFRFRPIKTLHSGHTCPASCTPRFSPTA
jgi:2-dehydropantoate 2-reductase